MRMRGRGLADPERNSRCRCSVSRAHIRSREHREISEQHRIDNWLNRCKRTSSKMRQKTRQRVAIESRRIGGRATGGFRDSVINMMDVAGFGGRVCVVLRWPRMERMGE